MKAQWLPDALQATLEKATFLRRILSALVREPLERDELVSQFALVCWRSLPTTLVAGLFTGAILAIQFYLQLRGFGAENVLGGLNTSACIREVGPVLIAFMLAGKVGAYTSAELASMRVSDQIEALRSLGMHPLNFLVVPRFLAVTLSALVLLCFGLIVSVLGGLAAARLVGNINSTQYLSMLPRYIDGFSVAMAVIKSFVFGLLMALICCHNGYLCEAGTAGVGRAVRRTAVQSMFAIVVVDFVVSLLARGLQS